MSHKTAQDLSQAVADLPFIFSPMALSDLPSIVKIEKASYGYPWPKAAFRQELLNRQAKFEVLRYRQAIIGYSGQWYLVDQAHIGTIVSHPKLRGCGFGEFLLINILIAAFEFPVETVTLEVRPSNQTARNLYLKYGFKAVGRRKNYYPDTGEDGLIMTTPLITAKPYQERFYEIARHCLTKLRTINLDETDWLT